MKKVLLAIDGIDPTIKIFRYALELCKWTKSELNVLQIMSIQNTNKYFSRIHKKSEIFKNYFEKSMIAVTYAEAGEHKIAKEIMHKAMYNMKKILPESEQAGVFCHIIQKKGETDKEIINYVKKHRDVVFTIYDDAYQEGNDNTVLKEKKRLVNRIKQKICIPLLVFNN